MPDFKTTFIPSKQPTPTVRARKVHKTDPITVASWFIFFLAIATVGGLYFYQILLVKNVESKLDDIKRAKESISSSLIERIKQVDAKLKTTKLLIENHTTLVPLFGFLEDKTLRTIRFSRFEYVTPLQGDNVLSLPGEAKNFSSIALQSDIFSEEESISEAEFSLFNITETGSVEFSLDTRIDKELLLYRNSVSPPASSESELEQESESAPSLPQTTIPENIPATIPNTDINSENDDGDASNSQPPSLPQ